MQMSAPSRCSSCLRRQASEPPCRVPRLPALVLDSPHGLRSRSASHWHCNTPSTLAPHTWAAQPIASRRSRHLPRAALGDIPWDSSKPGLNNGVPPGGVTPANPSQPLAHNPPWYATPLHAVTSYLQPLIQFCTMYQDIIKKLIVTLAMLTVHRVGLYIPLPGLDPSLIPAPPAFSEGEKLVRALHGQAGALPASIFELGISPYIQASIVITMVLAIPEQLIPSGPLKTLRDARKEGKTGQAYITGIMNYLALAFSVYMALLKAIELQPFAVALGGPYFLPQTTITLIAGSTIIQHCASIITASGIGNGSSLVICCSIVSEYAEALHTVMSRLETGVMSPQLLLILGAAYLLLALAAVYICRTELRLPILQYNRSSAEAAGEDTGSLESPGSNGLHDFKSVRQAAELRMAKRIKRSDYFPIPIHGSGMMSIILAGAFWFFLVPASAEMLGLAAVQQAVLSMQQSWLGLLVYGLLVFVIEFLPLGGINPKDVAEYFSAMNVGIKGVVPGEPTEQHVQARLLHCKFWGGLALGCLAVAAHVFDNACVAMLGASLSATSLLIIVGTVMQTSRQVESLLEGPKLNRQLQKEQSLIQSLTHL